MKYLQQAKSFDGSLIGKLVNGVETACHDTACFFMVMADKGVEPHELERHITRGEMVDPRDDWKEIRRIAKTFTEETAHA